MVSGGSGEEDEIPALNLVALIDILTNLLFFLLTIFALWKNQPSMVASSLWLRSKQRCPKI